LFGNGVVPALAPRMTTAYAFDSQPQAFKRSVFLKRFDAVLATRRMIAAAAGHPGRYDQLIESDKSNKQILHELPGEIVES
jgi:hypothetical protein